MAKLDGTNGLLQQYDYQVLTTAFSYTFASGTQTLIINPAGTLATGTVTMPAAPADGMVITIQSSQQITALTLNGNTGQTVVGTAVQIVPNQPLSWVYRLTNTTWYPFAGGAGRASTLVTGTVTASTSGTSIDYTNIPSWVKRITVMLSAVSTNGSSRVLVRLGDSGGIETSGYVDNASTTVGAATGGEINTNGFNLRTSDNSGIARHGVITISLLNASTYTWVATSLMGSTANEVAYEAGYKSLSDTLDRVRVTTANGIDTFDAGSINILFE